MISSTTEKISGTHEILSVFAAVFIIWGMYRMFFRLPVVYEEVGLKALIFGVPVWWIAMRHHRWKWRDLGISGKMLFAATYMGLFLGIAMGLIGQLGNMMRYGSLHFYSAGLGAENVGQFIILSLITAFWEQLLFSGYLLRRFYQILHNEWTALWWTACLFVLMHIPALVVVQHIYGIQLLLSLFLLTIMQLGCGILRLRWGNLAAPILAHALWGITIYLFR